MKRSSNYVDKTESEHRFQPRHEATPSPSNSGPLAYRFRSPRLEDGAAVYRLVQAVGGLELNSAYAYLLLCDRFADSSLLAFAEDGEGERAPVGVVLGFRPPATPDVIFVWQIGVHPGARNQGLGVHMLRELVRTQARHGVRFMEAHVGDGNLASEAMFRAAGRALGGAVEVKAGYAERDFPVPHAIERLLRIGPFETPSAPVTPDGTPD